MLQMLEFTLYRLSNDLLFGKEKYGLLRWFKQHQNGLLASFFKSRIPTIHACANNILQSVLSLGDADFLEILIDSGIDTSPLQGKSGARNLTPHAYQGNTRIVQILLKNGADANGLFDEPFNLINNLPFRPLKISNFLAATHNGHAHIVQLLLEAGANVNAVSVPNPFNALCEAVCRENVELIHILLTAGANIDICRVNGKSAIEYSALYTRNEQLHQILLSASSKDYSSITRHGVLEAARTDFRPYPNT